MTKTVHFINSPNTFIKTEIKSLSKTKAWRACVGSLPALPSTVPPAPPTVVRSHVCLLFLEAAPLTSLFAPLGLYRDITSSKRTSLISLPSFFIFNELCEIKLHVFKEFRGRWWRTAKTIIGSSSSAPGGGLVERKFELRDKRQREWLGGCGAGGH